MMFKLLNGSLPNIMSEICMVNNELHDHFSPYYKRKQSCIYSKLQSHRSSNFEFTSKEG